MNKKDNTDKWFHFLYIVIWPFFNMFRPVRALGRSNIPDGPAVICPNHSTIGDPFYIVFGFGRRHTMQIMAKRQVVEIPIIGHLLEKVGVFGVNRGAADVKAVKTALRCLKNGKKLLVFPEGTRVRTGENVDAKAGAALFATHAGVPLLPVYIPPKKRLFRFNTVIIGEPYFPRFEGRRPSAEELQSIALDLMKRVQVLGEKTT